MDKEGKVYNQFLDLVAVPDGKADTIVSAVKQVLVEKGVPTERLFGLGTDGAAVMTGNYLKPYELSWQMNPYILYLNIVF